jgi:hypothetical protein
LRVDVPLFSLQACPRCSRFCDTLEFYNKITGALLRRFCGKDANSFEVSAVDVLVKFHSNALISDKGFRMVYAFNQVPTTSQLLTTQTVASSNTSPVDREYKNESTHLTCTVSFKTGWPRHARLDQYHSKKQN